MTLVSYLKLLTFTFLLLFASTGYAASKQISWAGCGITKKAFMEELAKGYEKKTGVKVNLSGGGATKGIRNAVNGTIDIGGACRVSLEKHPEERSAYQIPVAWDALAVIVHKDNPVSSISFGQLQGVYLGKITNWKELGGNNAKIELYVRRGKLSGVGRTLRELVFANFNQEFPAATYVEKSSGPLEKGIEKNLSGFGTTGISSAKKRDVKILQLEGKAPSYDNIKQGQYLLYRPLYLVTQGYKSSPEVRKFISYALSREGMAIIRKAGTVPYADAIGLVMKQVEQAERASKRGLYQK